MSAKLDGHDWGSVIREKRSRDKKKQQLEVLY